MPKIINARQAAVPVGAYPHARKVGNLLYLSGIGPRETNKIEIPGVKLDLNGNIIEYDIEIQTKSVFNNVKLVLAEAGSSWDKLVDITVFLTNMQQDFKKFNKIYSEYFTTNQPCRTTIGVNSLPTPIAIELKCIAEI